MATNTKKEVKTAPKKEKAIVYIAKDELNEFENYYQASINGRVYNVLRGANVPVPLEVAQLLKETGVIGDYQIINQ